MLIILLSQQCSLFSLSHTDFREYGSNTRQTRTLHRSLLFLHTHWPELWNTHPYRRSHCPLSLSHCTWLGRSVVLLGGREEERRGRGEGRRGDGAVGEWVFPFLPPSFPTSLGPIPTHLPFAISLISIKILATLGGHSQSSSSSHNIYDSFELFYYICYIRCVL